MSFQSTYQWFWIDAVICGTTFILQTGLFTLHTLVSLQGFKIISFCNCFTIDSSKISKSATLITLFALFFYFIYGTDVFVNRIDAVNGEFFDHLSVVCNHWVRIGSISYQLSKGCIYCVFVLRLKLAFNNSHFAYSSRLLKVMMYVIIVYTLINAINGYFFVTADKLYIKVPQNGEISYFYTCKTEINTYVIAYMVLFDMIFTVMCMFMFISPLRQIIKYNEEDAKNVYNREASNTSTLPQASSPQINSHNSKVMLASQQKVTKEFKTIIIKYTIISCTALLSTFCGLILIGVTDAPAFSMIDVWINSTCLVLMCPQYDKYYKVLCCGLINCVRSKKVVVATMKSISAHTKNSDVQNTEMDLNDDEKRKQAEINNEDNDERSVSLMDDFNKTSVDFDEP